MMTKTLAGYGCPAVLVLLGMVLLPGCSDSAAERASADASADLPADASASPSADPSQAASPADREYWDVLYLRGARVGYARTSIRRMVRSGRELVRVEGLNHLAVKRFGDQTTQEIRFSSVETPEGAVIEIDTEIDQAATPMRTTGKVVDDRMVLETTTQGKKVTTSIPWAADCRGFYAVEQSLLDRPLQPHQQRTVRALVPGLNEVATVELTAKDYESVKLLGGTFRLLRIENVTRFSGDQVLGGTFWCDRLGETLKTRMEAMELETVRATKALALEQQDLGAIDLGFDMMIKTDRPLAKPHDTKRVRYRMRLQGGNPAEVFSAGLSQRVRSIDPHTAEVTVYALRGGQGGGNPDAPSDPPTDADRRPNNLIQSDDEKVVAMAREAAGEIQNPWKIALALERYVNGRITEVNFSQAFATAAEVAANPVGDCTEHAVLVAALARARGIPARVAVGLVYMEGSGAFGYHMWTEVHIEGRWIPIDATLGKGGIGAAHLKLAHSSLDGASAYSSFLPVAQVIGRLDIDVQEVQ